MQAWSHTAYFLDQSQRRARRTSKCGTSRPPKNSWVQTYALTFCFFMQSSDVTLPPASTALGREILSRSSSLVKYFVNKPRCLMHSLLPTKTSVLQESKCWSVSTKGNLGKGLIAYAISVSVRRWLLILPCTTTDVTTHFSCSKVPQSPCILPSTAVERFRG